jgi:hypothetical protein
MWAGGRRKGLLPIEFVDGQRPAEHVGEDLRLLPVVQRLRTGQLQQLTEMTAFGEWHLGDRGDVVLATASLTVAELSRQWAGSVDARAAQAVRGHEAGV